MYCTQVPFAETVFPFSTAPARRGALRRLLPGLALRAEPAVEVLEGRRLDDELVGAENVVHVQGVHGSDGEVPDVAGAAGNGVDHLLRERAERRRQGWGAKGGDGRGVREVQFGGDGRAGAGGGPW